MNNTLLRQTLAGLRLLLVATVVLGVAYPLAVWGVSRLPGLVANAEGSQVVVDGKAVGSSLIGIAPVPADPARDLSGERVDTRSDDVADDEEQK